MIRRPAIYKRKVKGILSLLFFSLLLFLGVFVVCLGVWFVLNHHAQVESPLPKVTSSKNPYTLTTKIQNLCAITHLNCTNITINNDNTATVTIDTDEQVILSLQKDLSEQFASLQLTIGHLTIEGKRFHRLDFRFDKPVISY